MSDHAVRIDTELNNSNFDKGSEHLKKELDEIEKKAKSTQASPQWNDEDAKKAEERIDRILDKKEKLAKEPLSTGSELPKEGGSYDYEAAALQTKQVEAAIEEYIKSADKSVEKTQAMDEHINLLLADVQEYAKDLKDLEKQGKYFGDSDYDQLYLAWKNADDAVRQYAADLNKQTEQGKAKEAEKAAKLAEQQTKAAAKLAEQQAKETARLAREKEKKEEQQRRAEEIAEKNLQRENAQIQKEAERQAKAAVRLAEQQAAQQRKMEETAEKNLQKENARIEKEALATQKLQEQEAEEQRLADIKKNAVVADQDMVSLMEEQESITKRLADLKKAGATDGYQEYEELTARLAEISKEIKNARNGFGEAHKSAQNAFDAMNGGAKKANGLFGKLSGRLKNLLLGVFIFNQIRRAFSTMVTVAKDGFRNLAQYSKNYNAQMSALKSSSAQLKNGLATAFSPIVTMALPYFTRLVSALNTACDAIARFMAAISGKNTYTKAKKQVVDYAKSLGTATDAAEGALAAFDEINVLETDSGGGTSAGGEATGADAFEEAEIDPEFLLTMEKVKEILEIIAPLVFTIGAGLLTWSIINFLSGLMQTHPLLGKIAAALMIIVGLVLAVYNYINMWKNGVDWGGLIGYIAGVSLVVAGLFVLFGPMAAGIALLVAGAAGIILALKDISENGMNAQNVTLLMISVVGLLIGIFLVFGATAAMIVAGIMAVIAIFAVLVKAGGNGREVINHLKDAFKALGDFVKKIFAGDFEGALESLKECGRSFGNFFISVAEGIANGFIKMVNMVIDAVNNMLPDTIPDWVPIIGGKSFPKIPHWDATCSLPRLANGAVIRGGQPFAAILGDQPKGQTNIGTPLDTMLDAFRKALDERDDGGTPVIRFEGSLAELGRVLRPVIEMENNRVGNSFGR